MGTINFIDALAAIGLLMAAIVYVVIVDLRTDD